MADLSPLDWGYINNPDVRAWAERQDPEYQARIHGKHPELIERAWADEAWGAGRAHQSGPGALTEEELNLPDDELGELLVQRSRARNAIRAAEVERHFRRMG